MGRVRSSPGFHKRCDIMDCCFCESSKFKCSQNVCDHFQIRSRAMNSRLVIRVAVALLVLHHVLGEGKTALPLTQSTAYSKCSFKRSGLEVNLAPLTYPMRKTKN